MSSSTWSSRRSRRQERTPTWWTVSDLSGQLSGSKANAAARVGILVLGIVEVEFVLELMILVDKGVKGELQRVHETCYCPTKMSYSQLMLFYFSKNM